MAWRRFLIVLAVVGPLLALLAYGFTRNPREIPSPLRGKPAPPFTLTLFDGSTLRLEDLRGKVVFLNFWASWCPPCRAEARTLEAAWQKYKDREVVFLGIDIQDTEEDARTFLREFGITYPNGRDPSGKIAIDYGVWGLPETFFIDREGRITYKHVGGIGWQSITAKLEEALRGIVSSQEGKGDYRQIR
ncbi:MAG: TlpA family protein disulfide reductase [Candidatus Rokubacteria bacterium]|nr:TlpA family protein disulfide reductase [Candidatus Rokubacteria bacterium]